MARRSTHLRFVSPRDRVLYLKSLPRMQGLPARDLLTVAHFLEERHIGRQTVLLERGVAFDAGYLIVRGRVGLYRDGERIDSMAAPASVGIIGILSGIEGPPGDIVAEEDCIVLAIDADALIHAFERSFSLLYNSLRMSAEMIFEARLRMPFDPTTPPKLEKRPPPDHPLDFVDRLAWQADDPAFRGANLDAIAEICREQSEVHYSDGEVIWEEGDVADFFLRTASGVIRCRQSGGRDGLIGADYSIGLFDMFAEVPRGYTAVAEEPVVALRLGREAMLGIVEDHPDLAMRMLSMLSLEAVGHRWSFATDAAPPELPSLPPTPIS